MPYSVDDLIHQAMFKTVRRGYSPRQVDAFIEQLKDACGDLEDKNRLLSLENENLRQKIQALEAAKEEDAPGGMPGERS